MIMTHIYGALFIVTTSAFLFMALRGYRNIDTYYWTLAIFIPVVCLAYFARSISHTREAALFANNVLCLDGTLLPVLYLMSMIRSFKIKLNKWIRFTIYLSVIIHTAIIWIGSFTGWYYKSFEIVQGQLGLYLQLTMGPLHFIHFLLLIPLILTVIAINIYIMFHPERCPRRTVISYLVMSLLIFIFYAAQILGHIHYDFHPIVFGIGSWVIALAYEHTFSHNINNIVMNMHDQGTETGYVAFSMNRAFLGANEAASEYEPEFKKLPLDRQIKSENAELRDFFYEMIDALENGESTSRVRQSGEKLLKYTIDYFYIRKNGATGGYLFQISDDTEHQHYLSFVQNYNKTLQRDINQQTVHIRQIQEQVVLGLATMIENRDYSTGGHVKRTSEIMKIVISHMRDHHIANLDASFMENIIRAAPMHDLGKIAVDNSILCKPGKLTEEEYEIMKTHPIKSGEIVSAILHGVEEPDFMEVAFNVARYHHEKWNGTGYPDKLMGESIPLEARIMAVVDVYDALVSKRCYKEPMSFETAAEVMRENMGTHFDPMMKEVFELSRPQLEEYYRNIE